MLEESKVQLDSKHDFEFISSELRRYIESLHLEEPPAKHLLDRICSILYQNIQIEGIDWQDLPTEQPYLESVDEALENKHSALVSEVDAILLQIAEFRSKYPALTKIQFENHASELLNTICNDTTNPHVDFPHIDVDIPDKVLEQFQESIAKLESMKVSIPEVVAKLTRARAVLCEEGSKRITRHELPMLKTIDASYTENLSELINREARIRRQTDLALKLGS